jgi:glycerol kinase
VRCARILLLLNEGTDREGKPVKAPEQSEITKRCQCHAGIAVGFWKGPDEVKTRRKVDWVFEPVMDSQKREALLSGWHKAVGRSGDRAE